MDSHVRLSVVTFLTDFGLQDDFVGTCHGVIARIAPDVRVIDVTHGIAPQAVLQGAIVLRNTRPVPARRRAPRGRRPRRRRRRAARSRCARATAASFVGPDNGLLMLAADAAGVEAAHELVDPRYRLADVSRTFHARDIFAPAAAHLASGVEHLRARRRRSTRPTSSASTCPSPWSAARRSRRPCSSSTASGTSRRTHAREHVAALGVAAGDRVEIRLALDRYYAVLADTFADAGRAS